MLFNAIHARLLLGIEIPKGIFSGKGRICVGVSESAERGKTEDVEETEKRNSESLYFSFSFSFFSPFCFLTGFSF